MYSAFLIGNLELSLLYHRRCTSRVVDDVPSRKDNAETLLRLDCRDVLALPHNLTCNISALSFKTMLALDLLNIFPVGNPT